MRKRWQKLRYFQDSVKKYITRTGFECPSCGAQHSVVVSRKYIVTTLRRCGTCGLLFRAPTTTPEEFARFYQTGYSEGFTTDMPSTADLQKMLNTSFAGSEKDYERYVSVLNALGLKRDAKLLDYGCSWGYGSWQFVRAGFNVSSFELSVPRCMYARDQLGVDAHSNIASLRNGCDVFFSAHVLEHIPNVQAVFTLAKQRVRKGGYFVAVTPNGSKEIREANEEAWDRLWGFVHPLFLDVDFYCKQFGEYSYYIDSTPFDTSELRKWSLEVNDRPRRAINKVNGSELLVVVRFC